MKRKTGGTLAVTAGLAVAVALSPVALPIASAYAEEGDAATNPVSAQDAGSPEDKSALGWHYGNWENSHLYVDLVFPWGICDLCGAPYWDGFGPGCGDDQEPEQQQGFITFQCTDPESDASTMQDVEGPIVDGKMTISEVPDPVVFEGYDFVGWSVCGGNPVSAGQLMGLEVSPYIVIEAVYEPSTSDPVIETHTVTFDDQIDETENIVVEVEDGDAVAEPEVNPTREGYSFEGWYTEPACLTPYDFSSAVTSDITLYAKWVEVEDPSIDPDDPVIVPEDPDTNPDDSGANPENPGDDSEDPNGGAQTSGAASDDEADSGDDALPETGDATAAVSGIAALGVTAAGVGALLRRRS